jgi:RimJ/RimL family protein N-acetyltransferase
MATMGDPATGVSGIAPYRSDMDPAGLTISLPDGARCVPLTIELVDDLHDAIGRSGPDLSRWMGWWHDGFTIDEAHQWIEFCDAGRAAGTHFEFAISGSRPYLGSCALTAVDQTAGTANLAYWTRSDHAGQHLASSAARGVAAWGVSALALRRVDIAMATANIPSRRVAERAGGVFEGILRNRVHVRGRSYNYALYALTPEDFHDDELIHGT